MADTETQPATKEPQKEDKLRAFLVELATQPQRLGEFIKDPDAAMKTAGLEAEDQTLLKSGNATAINARLRGKVTPKAPPPLLLVHLQEDGTPSIQEGYGVGTTNFPQQVVYPQPMYPPMQWLPWTPRPHIWAAPIYQSSVPYWQPWTPRPHIWAAPMQQSSVPYWQPSTPRPHIWATPMHQSPVPYSQQPAPWDVHEWVYQSPAPYWQPPTPQDVHMWGSESPGLYWQPPTPQDVHMWGSESPGLYWR
jgi:hypothetical protein